ncbi:MAG: DinB family protein [Pseudonocardia sp.]
MTAAKSAPDAARAAGAEADVRMARLQQALRGLDEGDLHRAHRAGGWTVAQVISHMNVATILWLGDLERLRHDPQLQFFFREEIGHDALGYPPPTVDIALRQLDATRRTLATCLPAVGPDVLGRTVEIPDLGTMTVAEWTPLIAGHLTGHVDQALAIMTDRGFLPTGSDDP